VIDPNKKYICGIIDRNFGLVTKQGFVVKDLRIFKDIDLSRAVIVDDFAGSFAFQLDNGIPIIPWMGDEFDFELKHLGEFLERAFLAQDVRELNRNTFKLD